MGRPKEWEGPVERGSFHGTEDRDSYVAEALTYVCNSVDVEVQT